MTAALDASVLIAYFETADGHHARATELMRRLRLDDLVVSTMTLAETLTGALRIGGVATYHRTLARLEVREVLIGHGDALRLAELREATRLKLPDCCVLLAARAEDAAVATFDGRLAAAARDLDLETVS